MRRAGQPATYGLETFRDVLKKLEWERDGLNEASEQDLNDLCYRAFNAAVTAWHLTDWVWSGMTPEQRQQLETDWEVELQIDSNEGGAFRGELKKANRELAICCEITNASKHFEITRNRDASIDTMASARTVKATDSDGNYIKAGKGFVVVPAWKLKVLDGDKRRDFIEIIDLVIEFWTDFINQRGIGK